MRTISLLFLFWSSVGVAGSLSDIYWSNHACDNYIYHFDPRVGDYRIYTRIDVEDQNKGKYKSYQLTEGDIKHEEGTVYFLSGENLAGTTTIDFIDMESAELKSDQFGRVFLIQCDQKAARKLIKEAEAHFKTCPKNVLNCKGL